jgi:hypothetical protein
MKTISHTESEIFLAPMNIKRVFFNAHRDITNSSKEVTKIAAAKLQIKWLQKFQLGLPSTKFHEIQFHSLRAHMCAQML